MKLLSFDAAKAWVQAEGYSIDIRGLPDLATGDGQQFQIPTDAGKRVALVRSHISAFSPDDELLVWLHDWSVWPSGQWMHMFYRFRKSYGCESALSDFPGHLIPTDEREAAVSIAVYAVLMLWDCYVIAPKEKNLIFYSHDEWGKSRTKRCR